MKSRRLHKKKTKLIKRKTLKRRTFKPNVLKPSLNCSPIVKGKTLLQDTCYTPDALDQIKQAYNKNNSDNPITTTDSKIIIQELRTRLTQCGKEDCWLNQIKDSEARRHLDKILFAPDQPHEWKNNPTEWLSNYDITAVLEQYEEAYPEFILLGPSSINYDTKLPEENGKCVWEDICRLSLQDLDNRGKRKLGIVFNLDKHDEPGSHWVSLFVDMDRGFIFYFDSGLNPVPQEITRLKNTITTQGKLLNKPIRFIFIKNKKEHQKSNTECGMYSLYFIITMLTGKPPDENWSGVGLGGGGNIIDMFKNGSIPDRVVQDLRDDLFNV